LYGYIEKWIGATQGAVISLSVETLVMAPLALIYVGIEIARGQSTFYAHGLGHLAAMAGLGLVTVAPLLAFNAAARRLPLSVLGLIQYLCPVMQFLSGLIFFHEPMPPARWAGFGIVWLALIVLTWSALRLSWWRPIRPSA
jgi:chloramphenicol-sensitive protein RarD